MPPKHPLTLFTLSGTFLNFNKLRFSFSDFSNHFYIHLILLCFSWYFFASLFLTEFKCMLFLSEKNLREYPTRASVSGVARVRHKSTSSGMNSGSRRGLCLPSLAGVAAQIPEFCPQGHFGYNSFSSSFCISVFSASCSPIPLGRTAIPPGLAFLPRGSCGLRLRLAPFFL